MMQDDHRFGGARRRCIRTQLGLLLVVGSEHAPMVAVVAAVSLVMFVASFFLLTDTNWSSDEGAIRIQAQTLSDGSWHLQRPFAEIDPEVRSVPIAGSTIVESDYAPYTKNPALPIVLSRVPDSGNGSWAVIPSLLFGMVAATLIAILTRRVDPKAGIWAFLFAALASPLFFYSYTVLAHTWLVVLAATMALLVALTVRNGLKSRYLFALFACAAIAPFLRREGLILALAVAVGLTVAGWHTERLRASAGAVGLAFAALGGAVLNNKWAFIVGGGQAVSESAPLLDVQRAFRGGVALLISGGSLTTAFLVMVFVLAVYTTLLAVLVHREPTRIDAHIVVSAAVVVSAVATVVMGGDVGGFFLAMPLLGAGLLVSSRVVRRDPTLRTFLIVGLLMIVGVVLTTSPSGGGAQWGGRYVLPSLPFLIPVAFAALADLIRSAAASSRRAIVVALVAASVATGIMAPISLRTLRQDVESFASTLASYAELVPRASEHGRSIIISGRPHIGRNSWRSVDTYRYLLVKEPWLGEYVDRLANAGAPSMLFVGYWSDEYSRIFEEAGYESTVASSDPYWVLVARAATP